ncbi:acyltransferase family protein [Nocardioides zeicaulis]|uniref:Acyltransferase family protein n=1 Tax=Nocardioides zeicaulis TaxID=1776857 RepID=A0ABV6E0R8_9ACTN
MSTAPDQARPSRRRTDIQVLRALAVGGVVLNHLFPHRLTGGYLGVDVFFVISGFLITSHLASEMRESGRIRLGRFWARRARRLLPASLLVLAVTLVATRVWLPEAAWQQVSREVLGSALYVQNWVLAASEQDYFRSSQSPSPVTHYWSLSVEEQFYLVWPVLLLVLWLVARRARPAARRVVLPAAMGVVLAASLAWATWALGAHPESAYFETWGRAWEFAAGALLGTLALPRVPRLLAAPGWLAMVGCMVWFDDSSAVPGLPTLLPVLGAALVIWAGQGSGESRHRVLRPVEWVGDVSYSLYLWHWPVIIIVPVALGRPMTPVLGLLLLAACLVLAAASTRFIEDPVRRARWLAAGPAWRSLVPAALVMALLAGGAWALPRGLAGNLREVQSRLEAAATSGDRCVGAPATANGCRDSHVLSIAGADLATIENSPYVPAWGSSCQVEPEDPAPSPCEFGVPEDQAEHRLVLVGDSHAGHWAAPLDVVAQQENWNVVMQVKSSCSVVSGDWRAYWATPEMTDSCRAWGRQVGQDIADDDSIEVVVVSAISREYLTDDADGGVGQLRAQWRAWVDAGKTVVVLGDPPSLDHGSLPECLGASTVTVDPCSAPRRFATPDPLLRAARGMDGVVSWSPLPALCDRERCHAVVGGLPVYGDQSHLLQYFARTFAPALREQLDAVLDGAGTSGAGAAAAPQPAGR